MSGDEATASKGMSKPPEMRDDGSTNPTVVEPPEFEDRYWKPHFAGLLLWGAYLLMIPLYLLGVLFGSGGTEIVILLALLVLLPLSIYAGIFALVRYHTDAKDIKRSRHDWRPLWPLWMLGHFLFSPLIVSPVYLLRRRWKVGSPTLADMRRALNFW